jgi:hypothetical protein
MKRDSALPITILGPALPHLHGSPISSVIQKAVSSSSMSSTNSPDVANFGRSGRACSSLVCMQGSHVGDMAEAETQPCRSKMSERQVYPPKHMGNRKI